MTSNTSDILAGPEKLKGWWTGKTFQRVGDGYLDCGWAAQALAIDVLETPAVVYDNSMEGVLKTTLAHVVGEFQKLGGRLVFSSPLWKGDTSARVFLVRPDSCVGLWLNDGDLEGRVVTTDHDFFLAGQRILEANTGNKVSAGRAYVLISTDEGPKLQSIGVAGVKLERENYNPVALEGFDHVVKDLKSQSPGGRLAIFDGIPGTGKTYMIRGLLSEVQDALFVLVPANLIQELANPGMVNALLTARRAKGDAPTVFIIEDADDCLGSRDATNVNAVSALLNLGDGIIGALMDIRLVCTTNLRNEELDGAVTRPGRLSAKIHVGRLERRVAESLYKKLTGNKVTIDESLTLAEVYSLARNDGWKPVERKAPMGFSAGVSPSVVGALKGQGITLDPEDLE